MANIKKIRDCVIIVPSNWNIDQRRLINEAAKIAGLMPLGFISENTAAAVKYAIDRQDLNETHRVLFYNLGSSSLKVSLIEFLAVNITSEPRPIETVKVLADYIEEEVSGVAFD